MQVNCEVFERVGAMRMTRGSERQRFVIQFYRFLEVLHFSCPLETRPQVNCEIIEGFGAIRMTRGPESERFAIEMNGFIDIVCRLSLRSMPSYEPSATSRMVSVSGRSIITGDGDLPC